jgi:hypothetical protein
VNASFIGFTGTPVDKTAYGKGTFKTFGCEDDKGYLHKYCGSTTKSLPVLEFIKTRFLGWPQTVAGFNSSGDCNILLRPHLSA